MTLNNRKIIITGGATREWIDPVRYISNASSGKMGIALADAAFQRSRQTVFIHGQIENELIRNKQYRTILIETTLALMDAVLSELAPGTIVIMAAAPVDFKPRAFSAVKIKKEDSSEEINLSLIKNPDILKKISMQRIENNSLNNIYITGFAAETNNLEQNALQKLEKKGIDMICLNDVSKSDSGFNSDNNKITVYTKSGGKTELPLMSKHEAAGRILDLIEIDLEKI